MASNAELSIAIVADASRAEAEFDAAASAATAMGSEIDRAAKTTENAGRRIDRAAESADTLDSKASQATGSLGALSAGFELAGAEKYATGLQSAAMATDFLSGVGAGLNLILATQWGANLKAAATTAAKAVAEKAAAAGTAALTAAQWLLNAAMTANPIALVVLALVALVAGMVIAYKRSEKFRAIVDAAFTKVKAAASGVLGFFKRQWPTILAILTGPIGLAALLIFKNFDKIKTAAGKLVDAVKGIPGKLKDLGSKFKDAGASLIGKFIAGLSKVAGFATSFADAIWDAVRSAINAGIDKLNNLLEFDFKVKGVGFEVNAPDIDHLSRVLSAAPATPSARTAGQTTVNVNVTGALDPELTARKIDTLLGRRVLRLGGAR